MPSDQRPPFLVAPCIELPSLKDTYRGKHGIDFLRQNGLTPALLLRNVLDSLQPHRPDRSIQLGYAVSINVYDLFARQPSGEWTFDPSRLGYFTDLFLEVGKPVVINLRANHFVGEGPLIDALMKDPRSFACLNDGAHVQENYYTNALFAPTFSLGEDILLNFYRFGGFRHAMKALVEFDQSHPNLVYAFTLAGELHHFLPQIADPTAAGQFEGARMTDYSPDSVRDFIEWLRLRHPSLSALNDRFKTPFGAWEEIEPPRLDPHLHGNEPEWMHMDSYAHGLLPVFGWAALPAAGSIEIFLDGVHLGQAELGLSRTDVYDVIPWLRESDIGFRFDIDYRDLSPTSHVIHAVLDDGNGNRYLVGRRDVSIGNRAEPSPHRDAPTLDNLPEPIDSRGRFAWLDHPAQELCLMFNPFALEWQTFREYQVRAMLSKFAQIAYEVGAEPNKLYSHLVMPHFEGCWNRLAFAVADDYPDESLFAPGLDLYGGSAIYRDLIKFTKGRRYAVPEMHPRLQKFISRDIFLRALQYHRELGAAFVCPYYMSLRQPNGVQANAVDAMMIHQMNPTLGSLYFYSALVEFLNGE
jgi:hypothetical protein